MRQVALAVLLAGVTLAASVRAREPEAPRMHPVEEPGEERVSVHFQTTIATQAHAAFPAKYSGENSMDADSEAATATLSTLFVDVGLWPGAELIFDPEMSGGKGLSKTHGVAAFPSGIVYRVGDPSPAVYPARFELRQSFGLGGGRVRTEAGPNQLRSRRDRDALTFSLGRLAVTDVFDGNAYAHDPTTQFFNWALFASGAWDYPADTRGYTWGLLSELSVDWWSVRAGLALEPKYANLTPMEWRVDKARGLMVELEARTKVGLRKGAVRLLAFLNQARMGSYQEVLDDPARWGNDITATREDGRTKWGFALSADQELTATLGAFLRASYNDGKNESWAFTEIDRSIGMGLVQKGAPWQRPEDEIGVAAVVDALSSVHRRYLAGGGYGFLLGDGSLSYSPEVVVDLYYRARIEEHISISAIYQPIFSPGYNRDRGPVEVFSGRFRADF